MKKLILPALLVALLSPWAWAQEAGTPAPMGGAKPRESMKQGATRLTLTNDSFVKKAMVAGKAEVELSNLALNKSQDSQVRAFAQRMVKDHTAAATELQTIAGSLGIAVPNEAEHAQPMAAEKLNKLSGTEFDDAYARIMQMDHDRAVDLFAAAAADQDLDVQLRRFAEKTLPVLRSHQQEAHKLPVHERAAGR